MDKKIILFELNEVPFRIVDQFRRWRPDSVLARRLPEFRQYQTYTEDVGSLSPWRTWPSLHRGVVDAQHLIYDFGQDLREVDREFPPLWRLLTARGIGTGLCGSLHSYPMPRDLEHYAFYLPDTFAAGSECFPGDLAPFQEFNLAMARESPRNVSSRVPWSSALRLLARTPELGLKLRTYADVGLQLLSERMQHWRTVRRRTYQAVLAFDVFMEQLRRTRPAFATFFTNHVASSMHRFWAAAFPDEYDDFGYDDRWVATYRHEIDFTMRKFDAMLGRLLRFVDAEAGSTLWVATSMGQAATQANPLETQLLLGDLGRFMGAMGLAESEWRRMPAMSPQVNVVVVPSRAAEFREALESLVIDGEPVGFRADDGEFFSIDFGHCNLYDKPQYATLRGRAVPFEQLALSNVPIQDKSGVSAYHIPQGCLMVYDPTDRGPKPQARPTISTLEVAPTILRNFAAPIPEYMRKPVPIGV